jgi:bifunctional enzyme CysN/CysC
MTSTSPYSDRESVEVVVVGHVDHGKSTILGRLLADSDALPDGKLVQVREYCRKNARPFEFAFLLDALKDEQAQGITIDVARCQLRAPQRNYIFIDAPGHIEFLKNMVTGAARAQAALLVIDAAEGIQENSRRHGTLLSLLGTRQVAVLVNKMDLVNYDQKCFQEIRQEFDEFLTGLMIRPIAVVPVSGMEGDNIVSRSNRMAWIALSASSLRRNRWICHFGCRSRRSTNSQPMVTTEESWLELWLRGS